MRVTTCALALLVAMTASAAWALPPGAQSSTLTGNKKPLKRAQRTSKRFVRCLARIMPVSTAKKLTRKGYLENRSFGYSKTKAYHAVAYNKKLETQCELMRATPAGLAITGIQAGDRSLRRFSARLYGEKPPKKPARPGIIKGSWRFFSRVVTPTCAVVGGAPGMALNGVTNAGNAGGKFMQHVAAKKLELLSAAGQQD